MPHEQIAFYNVRLIYKPNGKKASPFVSATIECMPAKSKEDAKVRALGLFALAGSLMQVVEVVEL